MEQRIVRMSNIESSRVIVELGPGTGGTTRAILDSMGTDSKLLCIEIDRHFAEKVQRIKDSRLIVHRGSAEDIFAILREHGLMNPDVIVSGIPFSTISKKVGIRILRAVDESLALEGIFVAYQLRNIVAKLSKKVFGDIDASETELLNIPPMCVYRWKSSPSSGSSQISGTLER